MFYGRKLSRILGKHTASIFRGNIKDAHIMAVLNMTGFYERTLSRVSCRLLTGIFKLV